LKNKTLRGNVMLSAKLVRLMLQKRQAGVPGVIRTQARQHIADNLGIAVAAAFASPIGAMVLKSQTAGGVTGACSVIGSTQTLPPALAAMVNSALAHIMDYDDIHDIARIHPTSVTLAAALAAAELVDAPGTAVVDGVIFGNELMCRLGVMLKPLGTGPGADWFLSQTFGYLGACLSAGLVLGLDEAQMIGAFGLAYMQMAGSKEPAFGIGANSRAIYTGFAAMGGVQAALLAQAGMIGPESALDGKAGMFPLYIGMQPSAAELDALLDPSGFVWTGTSVKPWPCCRSSHPYVSVALGLHRRVDPARIARVTVAVTAAGARLCRPLEDRRRPATLADAKYSIPFVTAFALVHGKLDLLCLDENALNDPAVLRTADKVDCTETLIDVPGPAPAEISIETLDGVMISGSLSDGLKLADNEVREKFLTCLTYAGISQPEAAWDRLQQIDQISARQILRAITIAS
jgi:2-methylcitrate dehydratase PrpD